MKFLCQQQGEAARCLLVWAVVAEKTKRLYLFGGGGFEKVIFIDCMN